MTSQRATPPGNARRRRMTGGPVQNTARSIVCGLQSAVFSGQAFKLGLAIPFLYPLVWLLVGALWPDRQPLAAIWFAPESFRPSLNNFVTAMEVAPMARFALNSLRVVVLAVPLTLLVAALAAFAMTQLPPRWQMVFVWLSLAALLAPQKALWLARFPLFKTLGWVNTPWPLVAPALLGGSPFFVLLLYWTFRRLPVELFEAAMLDGASTWQVWRRVAVPLARDSLFAVAILHFLHVWGDFADPLLYLRSTAQMTLPVGLRLLAEIDITRWPVVMAGATLLTIPAIVVFLLGQRYVQQFPVWMR
jgi:ABC-type glycerol-3-phosphate transport system permease component